MKYHTRTIQWRFRDALNQLPHLGRKDAVVVRSPADIADTYACLFENHVRERFVVFWLDAANCVIGFEVVTEGILTSNLAHPREVFRGAIVATAASIIVAHNHPSGTTQPSKEDVEITTQLIRAGDIIGIPVHDHIIISKAGFASLAELGLF